ncbi:hypothetical protein IW140_005137 [Coemansia sp. RSA 1813]|nr:hypothetical protein EV178_005115 [Coemansia sp. RSA 1646]KAJ1766816.1 hypothetical protein LPJ74_005695 [Coemansia sp. RSA 1843]KAJ2088017.1 hypothetical protein IW138_004525 [Coemansia sp. RSA 986]KAJ2211964.1 hypothetical protein EV179_005071 [Coemansia sp. RSA 487]KAJ2565855.1 hypothetical protein IW140_005137 [Coemansia sp. RSA 1813]
MTGVSDSLNTLGLDVASGNRRSFLDTPSTPSGRRTLGASAGLFTSGSVYSSSSASAEEKVVLDLGTYTLRAGFSGDAHPLHKEDLYGTYGTESDTYLQRPVVQRHGLLPKAHASEESEQMDALLECALLEHLRHVYRDHLLVDAKTKKVAIVESPMLPAPVKRTLTRVLLGNLRVPQVSFFPAPVLALMTCGRTTGLVVDCGHRVTTVTPVYDSRPLHSYTVATPLAGQSVHDTVRALVRRFAVIESLRDSPPVALSKFARSDNIDSILTDAVVRHIVTKLLYASPVTPPPHILAMLDGCRLDTDSLDRELVEWFQANASGPADQRDTRFALTTDVHDMRGVLAMPSWIRERSAEVLLAGDKTADHMGTIDALIACIAKTPVDTRRALVRSILVTGGVANMPNFSARVLQDLRLRLESMPRWRALAKDAALADCGSNGSLFAAADRPWIGASLAVAAKIGGVDVRRDEFDESPSELLSRLD